MPSVIALHQQDVAVALRDIQQAAAPVRSVK